MLRRLLAALLVAAIAAPAPAIAAGRCSMMEPGISAGLCDCCKTPGAAPGGSCSGSAATSSGGASTGCGCAIGSPGSGQPAAAVSTAACAASFESVLIPASLSTPQRFARAFHLAASPPGAGASVDRPRLCTWII